jgi:hypothetical protein
VAEHGAVSNREQRLGQLVREGTEPLAEAST